MMVSLKLAIIIDIYVSYFKYGSYTELNPFHFWKWFKYIKEEIKLGQI